MRRVMTDYITALYRGREHARALEAHLATWPTPDDVPPFVQCRYRERYATAEGSLVIAYCTGRRGHADDHCLPERA